MFPRFCNLILRRNLEIHKCADEKYVCFCRYFNTFNQVRYEHPHQNERYTSVCLLFCIQIQDLNLKKVSGVKKTVLWTVFSREARRRVLKAYAFGRQGWITFPERKLSSCYPHHKKPDEIGLFVI